MLDAGLFTNTEKPVNTYLRSDGLTQLEVVTGGLAEGSPDCPEVSPGDLDELVETSAPTLISLQTIQPKFPNPVTLEPTLAAKSSIALPLSISKLSQSIFPAGLMISATKSSSAVRCS